MGGGLIRGKLFMCSFSTKKTNAACAALFDRLMAKGKNKELALIAVCNMLLKQAFTIVKSGVPYQADFYSRTYAVEILKVTPERLKSLWTSFFNRNRIGKSALRRWNQG